MTHPLIFFTLNVLILVGTLVLAITNLELTRAHKHRTALLENLVQANTQLHAQLVAVMRASVNEGERLPSDHACYSPAYRMVCELRDGYDKLMHYSQMQSKVGQERKTELDTIDQLLNVSALDAYSTRWNKINALLAAARANADPKRSKVSENQPPLTKDELIETFQGIPCKRLPVGNVVCGCPMVELETGEFRTAHDTLCRTKGIPPVDLQTESERKGINEGSNE